MKGSVENSAIIKAAVSAAPYSIDKPYDYLVPAKFLDDAFPGIRVLLPFGRGNRVCEGIILFRGEGEKRPGLKPILKLLDQKPVLDESGIALALWIRQRYFCTMFEAIRTILPAGLWYRLRKVWRLSEDWVEQEIQEEREEDALDLHAHLSLKELQIVQVLKAKNSPVDLETLEKSCGPELSPILRELEKKGVLVCETDVNQNVKDKTRRMAELTEHAQEFLIAADYTGSKKRISQQRKAVLNLLSASGRLSTSEICYFTGVTLRLLRAMEKDELLKFTEEEEFRVPQSHAVDFIQELKSPAILNTEQEAAFQELKALTKTQKAEVALLQGVTGSGKTLIYLHMVQEILSQGRNAIVLVPEIALTPQIMQRFSSCFGDQVALFHSGLRLTERYDQWKRVKRGEVRVVLGTRSAIFTPLSNLGLIILDEEQEGSYQSENIPSYHARDVAKYLCVKNQALLILGSATPAIESVWAAENGIYHHVKLTQRYNGQPLPDVLIADLREEIRRGNPGLIGQALQQELEENLCRGEQSILFLNRRGNSRMLLCGECGYVPECPHCSLPLTYHSANGRLMCHHCGHTQWAFDTCPQCKGIMRRVGVGTQKVEEELRELFPKTKLLRMDADTVSGKHGSILRKFEQEKIPILLGTQMVAKGLDFGNVTLAGVLSADLSLYVDSYRAAERTFSLLTQVVGRAGRGGRPGRAVIQTYTPEHDVIRFAAKQDYQSFYEGEIRLRKLRRCPPFADIFTFTISGFEEGQVLESAAQVRERLYQLYHYHYRNNNYNNDDNANREKMQPEILGPAPPPILKLNNRYRYRVLLVDKNNTTVRNLISRILKEFANKKMNRGLHISVDCNAAN